MNPRNWYKECGDVIRKEFGRDANLFIDLLAATSPRKSVQANWRLAMRVYHVWQNQPLSLRISNTENWLRFRSFYDNLMQGTLPAHRPNIIRALQRKPLSGNKVRAFAANLKGDLNAVTIDVWICRYYGWPDSMNDTEYEHRADFIRAEADMAGMCPAEYQAVIWYAAIRNAGKTPKSYLSRADKNQKFFEWYF